MLAYDALEALRSDGSNAEARATFERHRAQKRASCMRSQLVNRRAQ